MRSIHSISQNLFVLFAILSNKKSGGCNPITNSNLNDRIREFSSKDDNVNSTRIKTLQKEEPTRYANFSPVRNPVRFKDARDSAIASSSYSRGLHHEHTSGLGYSAHDYEETPHIGYGYEYNLPETHHAHHGYEHHVPDYYRGHHHVDYHHKHYDHALAAKTILWPIAGIALLGAAAALVSNPILLQLGVVSGKRKRRDTEEIFEPGLDAELSWMNKKDEKPLEPKATRKISQIHENKESDEIILNYQKKSYYNNKLKNKIPFNRYKKSVGIMQVYPTRSTTEDVPVHTSKRISRSKELNESKFVPVPLVIKENI